MADEEAIIPVAQIEKRILVVRGERVMLDSDLAEIYGVETKVLNQAVRRNIARFPEDFMFELTDAESTEKLRSQIVTSSDSGRHGGRRRRPLVFTEQGVAMLSSVLRSPRAIQANIHIMRAFVRLRRLLIAQEELAQRLEAMEKKYDKQIAVILRVLDELMEPPALPGGKIGFAPPECEPEGEAE